MDNRSEFGGDDSGASPGISFDGGRDAVLLMISIPKKKRD
jgi:hypothetical protein